MAEILKFSSARSIGACEHGLDDVAPISPPDQPMAAICPRPVSMQQGPLTVASLLGDAERQHGDTETVSIKRRPLSLSLPEQQGPRLNQGRAVLGIEMRPVDGSGQDLPFDGRSIGELLVRGTWIVQRYLNQDADAMDDGWFRTGDAATIDADGYLTITDRAKDLVKSGGEWIGSIEVESLTMACPGVAMVDCIAVPHPTWDERPWLVLVKRPGAGQAEADVLHFLSSRLPKWQVPARVEYDDALPMGGSGKVLKQPPHERLAGAAREQATSAAA